MKKIVLAAVLSTMAVAASAQVYVGGHVGQSHVRADCSGDISCDKSDTGYKLTAGYKLNPVVALEASYVNFGKLTRRVLDDNADPATIEVKANGFLFAAAFRHQATPEFGLVGRLGLSSLKSKGSFRSPTSSESENFSSTKPYIGLGAEYALTKQVRLTAGADFTRIKLDDESSSVRLLSIGAQYDF